MADGFIVRRGGVEAGEPIPAPTITLVSKTDSSITFTLTNNSVEERDVTFGLTTPPTTTTITLASQATSGNQTFSNLDDDTTFIIFAQAADGVIGQLSVTTDKTPVFTAATGGTTLEYDSGGKRFRSHTFTSDGNFVVSTVGDNIDNRNKVDYLIIAGGAAGGSGGNNAGAGGGGAGGYRTTLGTSGRDTAARDKVVVTATTFGVFVGAGGTGVSNANGNAGTNSSALSVTSLGGGFGTYYPGGGNNTVGGTGGSGGGAGSVASGQTTTGGTGTTDEGFNGGNGTVAGRFHGGGGGGAGSVGQNANPSGNAGNGGAGLNNLIRTGSSEARAGGGGGGAADVTGSAGTASAGAGAGGLNTTASNATANTGSGGGGSGGSTSNPGGNGGAGIVVIRYEIAPSV